MTVAPEILHHPPAGFHIREASKDDVENLTSLWYSSFNPSHPFWDVATPDDAVSRRWWNDTWSLGLQAGPDVLRTFVVEDLAQGGRLAAVARWNVPQDGGRQDIPLPEFPAEWDTEVTEALWGGMPLNRREVMVLEFLGVDQDYQGKGLGFALLDWGCRQAGKAGLEVYLGCHDQGPAFL
ncbi:Acyl-CoA N-acyltransferase [Apiospora marii]|uniref:Acyl-CoA N-acyltransferase n=1 Tax=Apiospora marii TaxID=335849 RepID=A0ABR1RDR7_9PEZI